MPKGILDIGEVLALKEVIDNKISRVDDYFKVNITSLERFLEIVNSPLIRSANGIRSVYIRDHNPSLTNSSYLSGARFFVDGKLDYNGPEEQRLTYEGEPLGIAFTDGGVEYLDSIYGYGTDTPSYGCELFVPSTRLILAYNKPVEDEKVLKVIRNGAKR